MSTYTDSDQLKVSTGYRQILSIALPISLSILIPQLNLLINNVFLGHLNSEALGNAGVTGVFYLVFSVAGFGLNNALQSLLSSYAGSGESHKINTGLSQGIRMSLILAICFMAFVWLTAPFILSKISSPAAAVAETSFLHIRIVGLPFLFLFQLGNAVLVSTLNSNKLIIGFFVQAVTNILLDYLLIFGHAGLPAMGFNGAAWSSVISEFMGMCAVLIVLIKSGLKTKYALFVRFTYEKAVYRNLRKIATPLVFQYIISLATWLVFFVMIEPHGETAKGISNCMRNVFGVAGIFVWAFSGTCNTMVANLMGQKKYHQIIPLIKRIMWLSMGLCIFMISILNIFPGSFFALFGQSDDFIKQGIPVIRVVSVGLIGMSIANIWLNGLTGIGNTKINLIIEITAITLYLIYTWYFTSLHYTTLSMAWSNEFVYWLTIFFSSFLYIKSKKWMSPYLGPNDPD